MILSFSIENFRSFHAEQTLNLLASKRLGANRGSPQVHKVPGIEEHVLRVASLYGANGAGKSNVVRALSVLKRMVLEGTSPGELLPYEPFLLDDEGATKPTCFDLQFVVDEDQEVYRYGAAWDAERVYEEWLSVYKGNRECSLFHRIHESDDSVSVKLGEFASRTNGSEKIAALSTVGARSNQLFLTEVVNHPVAQGRHFRSVIDWFKSTLQIVKADAQGSMLAEAIASDAKFADFAGRLLREADTGIGNLDIQTELLSKLEQSEAEVVPIHQGLAILRGATGEQVFVEDLGKNAVRVRKVFALHNSDTGQQTSFPLHEESDGSQRFLNLLPALYLLTKHSRVLVIDELERSMHPMLARKFIEFFLKAARGTQSQLIFTTHESTLLDLDLMRRDGIWFAEKDETGATHLYSLADFKVRNDLRIEKGYLEGRFGAIPFLGGMDRLIEEQNAAEENG